MSTLVHLQYGYDRASNRAHRLDELATKNSQHFDERYGYDGLHRLTSFDRGQLDTGGNNLTNATLGQTWNLDSTGNWGQYEQTAAGAFKTIRTHSEVNEIETISTPTGTPIWNTPSTYDANGNMTEFPQPKSLENGYTATYDAWNRLVKLEDSSGTVAEYEYDGLNRRTIKKKHIAGSLNETRHFYYSDQWQVLEERVDANTTANKQYVWGLRYIDDLVLRDKGTERLYALQDALFNVVALTDDTGAVKERFAYQPYGESEELNPDFTTYTSTNYVWEYRFTGRELDLHTGLQINRNRYLHLQLGRWLIRDPIGYEGSEWNLYEYVGGIPLDDVDPSGEIRLCGTVTTVYSVSFVKVVSKKAKKNFGCFGVNTFMINGLIKVGWIVLPSGTTTHSTPCPAGKSCSCVACKTVAAFLPISVVVDLSKLPPPNKPKECIVTVTILLSGAVTTCVGVCL